MLLPRLIRPTALPFVALALVSWAPSAKAQLLTLNLLNDGLIDLDARITVINGDIIALSNGLAATSGVVTRLATRDGRYGDRRGPVKGLSVAPRSRDPGWTCRRSQA